MSIFLSIFQFIYIDVLAANEYCIIHVAIFDMVILVCVIKAQACHHQLQGRQT